MGNACVENFVDFVASNEEVTMRLASLKSPDLFLDAAVVIAGEDGVSLEQGVAPA